MSDLNRDPTHPKARKQHQCIACYYPIATGETYTVQTGFYDGSAYRNKFHAECFDALCAEGEGEFSAGSYDPPERLRDTQSEGQAA